MEKAYNLSVLFEEGEFDVQKSYQRYGSKEAFFPILHRFTLDSKTVLDMCRPERYANGDIDIDSIKRYTERLQKLLVNIGAIKLAWGLQRLSPLFAEKNYREYVEKLGEVLLDVDRLRERIISAEKTGVASPCASGNAQAEKDSGTYAGSKYRTKLRLGDFEKLLMLIDNLELESAQKSADLLMKYNYNEDISESLSVVCKALEEFDSAKALIESKRLLSLAKIAQEPDKLEKKTVLAIDDIPSVLTTVEAMLKETYNVYCMTDYESAVKFLCGNTADLILLDIEMPGLDGFAMMQLFRSLPEYAKTPILFLTGSVSDEHIKMAMSLGARDFIKKPVDLTVLLNKLENALSENR